MKLLIFWAIFAIASCEIDFKTFDWSTVKPLHEIKVWRDAHPSFVDISSEHRPRAPRIVNGEIAAMTDFPYMAGVMLHFDTVNSWCGGSLISRSFVLTAAHCVHVVPSSSVLLGTADTHNVQQNIRVSIMRPHPGYNPITAANNIATLQLMELAELGPLVGLVRLPNWRQEPMTFDNQEVIISGWGRTSTGNTQPIPTQFLRFLRARVITNLSCRIRFPNDILASNVCTDPVNGTPCEGDQGGPLMITEADNRRTQIAVFSFYFSPTCDLGWPPIYTRTTSYLSWIEANSDVRILDNWE